MKITASWLKRKKASLCILAAVCAVSLFVIINSGDKIKQNTGGSYAVKIKHYGIDAGEIERSITIPLEDAFFLIPGIMSVQSSSANSVSSVFIRFKPGTKGRYEAVRDAAQRVYETLPSSAQRPEILSSNNSMIPVWSAAVAAVSADNNIHDNENDIALTAQMLERIVKPRFESLEGAGEVIVSGAGVKEIYIILDQQKLSQLGLEILSVSSVLAMNDSIFSGGSIVQQNREIVVSVDGRYGKTNALEKALIPFGDGRFVELSQIALITEQEREPDIFSRLNGNKTVSIAVMGRHGADLRKLSSDIKKELGSLSLPLEFTVLSDLGAEEASAFRSVFYAALLGAIMTAIISFLLIRNKHAGFPGFFCALAIPLICLISAAILNAAGFSLDKLLLAGIAAGIGTAIDAVILCSEKLRKCADYNSASAALSSLTAPLLAGAATTVAALIPLMAIEDNGVNIIAASIAVVTVTALVFSLTLLPPLLLWRVNRYDTKQADNTSLHRQASLHGQGVKNLKRAGQRFSRFLSRFLASTVRFSVRYPVIVLTTSLLITVSAIFMLIAKGVDTSGVVSEDSVYAQVEFDGGLLAEEVDRSLAAYSRQLLRYPEILNVETGARTGSGSLLISFDPKKSRPHLVRELAKQIYIPGGFIFFHENSSRDRYWEIFIYGDEDQKCRELAKELAYISADYPIIKERVLNFKQGSKKMIMLPDREKFAESNAGFFNAAVHARFGVYGPVAYKRIGTNGEIDVRIRTGNAGDTVMRQSREGALNILVPAGNSEAASFVHLSSLMEVREETEQSNIRRDNRRRFASVTIATKPMDARRVKQELASLFDKLELPPGYSIEFDPDAVKQSENVSATVLSLIMAIVFCYMIIASINESFTVPLLILSAIPPSLAIPAVCLVLSGSMYNAAVACAFIAVSGMSVNAAVLCVDSIRSTIDTEDKKTLQNMYLALRRKAPALLATTSTTIVGAIPFLFLTEGANSLIRTLSLTGALGITFSSLCSITVIPSFLSLSKNSFKFFSHKIQPRLYGNSAFAGSRLREIKIKNKGAFNV